MVKPKILVVDGDLANLHRMKGKLEKWGFQVFVAVNRSEFETAAFKITPDLIILDIMLGDQNAAHVYDNLITRGLDRKIPVIFLSDLVNGRPESYGYPGRTYSLHRKAFEPEQLRKEIDFLVKAPRGN